MDACILVLVIVEPNSLGLRTCEGRAAVLKDLGFHIRHRLRARCSHSFKSGTELLEINFAGGTLLVLSKNEIELRRRALLVGQTAVLA